VVPRFGRFTSNFVGYVSARWFSYETYGECSESIGLPSGTPLLSQLPTTCDVNCQCVTITPSALLLPGADTISYEITTADDPYFASPLYVESPRPVNPILADEKFTQCGLPAGNYLGRYIVETASDVTESEPCAFSIIELGISVWAGWRTAADFAGTDPVADFSYAVVSGAIVQFTDASYDMDGTIEAWLWQFKDENGTILATSTDQNPSYDFGSIATYQVTLTVQDDDLHTDSITETVSL
jgi:PKD repeat protein